MHIGLTFNFPTTKDYQLMVKEIEKILKEEGYVVSLIPISFEDLSFIEKIKKAHLIFNLHTQGRETKQVIIPSICDFLGIKYIGSNAYTHSLCVNKNLTKIVLNYYGIDTPKYILIPFGKDLPKDIDLSFPLFVKPNREGSGKGIRKESLVDNRKELEKAVKFIHEEFEEEALVEEYIEGKEISVGIIGNNDNLEILPLLEIDFSSIPEDIEKFYSERVKKEYGDKTKYICPARIEKNIEKKIEEISKKIFTSFGLRDYARIDMRIKEDKIHILDVNSLPLLIPNYSDIIKMANAKGYSYKDLILKILQSALKRIKGT